MADEWTDVLPKRKDTLWQRLLDLAVETGQPGILAMARKAKTRQLGDAQAAKAWKLVGNQKRNDRRSARLSIRPSATDKRAAEQRAAEAGRHRREDIDRLCGE